MCRPFILPSPNDYPAEYVAWALDNPLLLAKYPQKLAATRAAFEAGEYTGPRLHELAVWLYEKRVTLRRSTPVVDYKTPKLPDWLKVLESRDTTDKRVFSQQERGNVRLQLMLAHSTELDWIGARIQTELAARMAVHLEQIAALIADPEGLVLPF